MSNNQLVEVAIKATVAAGKILSNYYTERVEVASKESSRDIVSEVDYLAENSIIAILKDNDPSVSIITEEQGWVNHQSGKKYWLIDALDGTVNYVHHIPFFCVSVAFIDNNTIQAGAIYAPMFNDIYYGARSVGVFKNDKALHLEDTTLKESVFAVSFSGKNYQPDKRNDEFILFAKINDSSRGCLRTGSAALNLAYLSEGRFNGCWGKANKYWDVAAGLLLAELAGAKVTIKQLDQEKKLYSYLASTPSTFNQLSKMVKKVIETD